MVCLQELKSETFPQGAIRAAGYEAVWQRQKSWNGVAILARGKTPIETRRGLPGDAGDTHSRYIEAAFDGLLVGCRYLPNGNPAPGLKFDFKLRWFERLIAHAAELLASGAPVALVGHYNVMPTELDVYKPERWVNDALFRVEVREAFSPARPPGLDGCAADPSPGRANLHILGLFSQCLRARRWVAHRPPAREPIPCSAADCGRRQSRGARVGESERPRAGLDRTRGRADTAAEPNRPAHPGATEGHARRSGRSPISAQNHWPGSFVILGRSATPIAGAAQALNSVVTIRTLSTLAPSR